jgi:hypothetical protein
LPEELHPASMETEEELLKNFEESQCILEPKIAEELVEIPVPCSIK